MGHLVLEGIWEEILTQQEHLRGKRVRVTVLEPADSKDAEQPQAANLLEFLAPYVGTVQANELPPARDIEKLLGQI
jgi:hypothetical protein